jgi:hypothetical protein
MAPALVILLTFVSTVAAPARGESTSHRDTMDA